MKSLALYILVIITGYVTCDDDDDHIVSITRKSNGDEYSLESRVCTPCRKDSYCFQYNDRYKRCCKICKCDKKGTFVVMKASKLDGRCLVNHKGDCNHYIENHAKFNPSVPLFNPSITRNIGSIVNEHGTFMRGSNCDVTHVQSYEYGRWLPALDRSTFGIKEGSNVSLYMQDDTRLKKKIGSIIKVSLHCKYQDPTCVIFKVSGKQKYYISEDSVKVVPVSEATVITKASTHPTKAVTTLEIKTLLSTIKPTLKTVTATVGTKTSEPTLTSTQGAKTPHHHSHGNKNIRKNEVRKEEREYEVIIMVIVIVIVFLASIAVTVLLVRKFDPCGCLQKKVEVKYQQKKLSRAELLAGRVDRKREKTCSTISNENIEDYEQLTSVGTMQNVDLYHNLNNKKKKSNPYVDADSINQLKMINCGTRKNKNSVNVTHGESPQNHSTRDLSVVKNTANDFSSNGKQKKDSIYMTCIDDIPEEHLYKVLEENYYSAAADGCQQQQDEPTYRELYEDTNTYATLENSLVCENTYGKLETANSKRVTP